MSRGNLRSGGSGHPQHNLTAIQYRAKRPWIIYSGFPTTDKTLSYVYFQTLQSAQIGLLWPQSDIQPSLQCYKKYEKSRVEAFAYDFTHQEGQGGVIGFLMFSDKGEGGKPFSSSSFLGKF